MAGVGGRHLVGAAGGDRDLLKVLAVDASSHVLRMRILLGAEVTSNTAGWLGGVEAAEEQAAQLERALRGAAILASVSLATQTRVGGLDGGDVYELLRGPLVTGSPLSEQYGLEGPDGTGLNYIRWLHDNASSNRDAIKHDALPGTSRPLLYRLLRHALLLEMDRLAFTHLLAANVVTQADRPERELVGLTTTGAPLTTYERIDRAATDSVFVGSLAPYLGCLAKLATLPTAELERRFGETLDACSHRLDAWITAAATDRLRAMRTTTPEGCYLGGFGFVENVRPAEQSAPVGGFIHAPSPAHAGAAAILRNGFLSRGGSGSVYDVDLSSARVRSALTLIDGVRQGEPLDSLLGQTLERDLHDRQLEPLIAPLRGYFPLVAGKTSAGDGPTELVAAGNVVDGLALRQAWNAKAAPFVNAGDLPALTSTQLTSFHAALDALNDAVDGIADVLTAESIFQAVRGNPTATAASLDAMAAGVLPPMPEATRTPLAGNAFAQRLAIALAPGAAPADNWGAATPRAAAEPALDHWIGTLLGPPDKIGCRVVFPDGSNHDVRLDALALRPIDLVALARTRPTGVGDGELDRRVLAAATAPVGAQVHYDITTAAWSLADALELAGTIGALLAVARPLAPADLVLAVDSAAATVDQSAAADAAARAQAAIDRLTGVATALDQALGAVSAAAAAASSPDQLAALRAVLEQAATYGVVGAYPPADADADALVTLAAWVKNELAQRRPADLSAPDADPGAVLADARAAVQTVFGRDFLFLPQLDANDLAAPLAASHTLLGDANAPRRALQQLARVRPNLGRWRSLGIYAQAFGAAPPPLEVVQLPAATTWAGNPGAEIASGTLSLILHRPTHAPPSGRWVGLVVDEWTEVVPSTTQGTALSFRYESPVAEPPQAVLLAVPPTTAPSWDRDTLLDTVRETLLLAKIRAVDSSLLDSLRPFLPAICLTGNTANETVSTDFLELDRRRARIEDCLMASMTYWSQLRPSPRTPSVAAGLAAGVRDPAWLLARQWQLAEFEGLDGGSPAYVRIGSRTTPFESDRDRRHDRPAHARPAARAHPRGRDAATRSRDAGRARTDVRVARTGSDREALPRRLPDRRRRRGCRSGRDAVPLDLRRPRHRRRGALPGRQGGESRPPCAPRHAGVEREPAADRAARGRRRSSTGSSRPGAPSRPANHRHGIPTRLDYSATVAAGGMTLTAEPDSEAALDWYAFDLASGTPPAGTPAMTSVIPGHVRFRGMPNPRWWDFESSATDFGALLTGHPRPREAALRGLPAHPRRRLVPRPSRRPRRLALLDRLPLRHRRLRHADVDSARRCAGREHVDDLLDHRRDNGGTQPCLIAPASAAAALQASPPLEELHLLRDETADMAWAIERIVESAVGSPTTLNPTPEPSTPATRPPRSHTSSQPRYLPTGSPSFPSSPPPTGSPSSPGPSKPARKHPRHSSSDSSRATGSSSPQHELTRAGLKLQRVACRTRTSDGHSTFWVARRRHIGAGEASSGLRYDQALAVPDNQS